MWRNADNLAPQGNMNPSHDRFYNNFGQTPEPSELTDMSSSHFVLKLSRDELALLNYPVICENWHHCVGPQASGSKKRKFEAAFSKAERKILSSYNQKFYRWHLVTGPPPYFLFGKIQTIGLIQRAAGFFAST